MFSKSDILSVTIQIFGNEKVPEKKRTSQFAKELSKANSVALIIRDSVVHVGRVPRGSTFALRPAKENRKVPRPVPRV